MPSPDRVPQGSNYDFEFALEGLTLGGFAYTLEAKQYPDDTAAISRTVTANSDNVVLVTLTPAETAALAIGLWYISVQAVDTDETVKAVKRIQVSKAWL